MLAFHNDPNIKAKYLDRVKAHRAADEIIKGKYWENGKGCAVGCTIHSGRHRDYEAHLGIPGIIARLEDKIFENLPDELAMTWPERFLEAIPVGADLSKVWPKFAIFLLTDSTQCNLRHPQCKIVASYFQSELDGNKVNWGRAFADADAAAAYAADADAHAATYAAAADAAAATYAADAYAAYAAAADAADAAAAYAADAADAADADAADAATYAADARGKAYVNQSEQLLLLLRESAS